MCAQMFFLLPVIQLSGFFFLTDNPDDESIVFALNHGEKTPERGMIRTETCPLRKQYFSPPQV